MDLAEIVAMIGRRWRTIVLTVVVALVAAAAVLVFVPRQYEARTDVYVTTTGGDTPDQALSAFTLAQHRAKAYAQAVASPLVLGPVAESTNYPGGASALEQHVSASVELDSVVVNIVVSDARTTRAVEVAAAVADQLGTAARSLSAKTDTAVGLEVIRPASSSGVPASPSTRIVVAVALAAGLLLGLVLARIRDIRAAAGSGPASGETRQSRRSDRAAEGA